MLIGKTFGYWTIIAHAPDRASIQSQLCRCKCGTIKEVRRSGLENGQLDRIDNKGHYNKANCRWSTRSENLLNRADSLTFRGQKMSRENIAKAMGITRGTLARRMKEYPSLTLEEMYYL